MYLYAPPAWQWRDRWLDRGCLQGAVRWQDHVRAMGLLLLGVWGRGRPPGGGWGAGPAFSPPRVLRQMERLPGIWLRAGEGEEWLSHSPLRPRRLARSRPPAGLNRGTGQEMSEP